MRGECRGRQRREGQRRELVGEGREGKGRERQRREGGKEGEIREGKEGKSYVLILIIRNEKDAAQRQVEGLPTALTRPISDHGAQLPV